MVSKITGVVIVLIGLVMLYMGGKLLLLGGSIFYAFMAVGLLITGILLLLKKQVALSLYALLMWVVLFWTIWEVGFDKWQWIPRGDLFGMIGLWLALPWIVRPLTQQKRSFHPSLGSTVIVMIALVLGMFFYDPLPVAGTISNEPTNHSSDLDPPSPYSFCILS